MSAIAFEAKRPSASQRMSDRSSGQSHFYWAQTSSAAGAKHGGQSTPVRNDRACGSQIRIRNEYDCQIPPPEADYDQQIHFQEREITRVRDFPRSAVAPRRDGGSTSHARRARAALRERPPGRSLRASRRPDAGPPGRCARSHGGGAPLPPPHRRSRRGPHPPSRCARSTGRCARPWSEETRVSCPGDPITDGSVRQKPRRCQPTFAPARISAASYITFHRKTVS